MDKELYEKVGKMDAKIDSLHEKFDDFKNKHVTKGVFKVWTLILIGTIGAVGYVGKILIANAFN